jgi:hypothetical protein
MANALDVAYVHIGYLCRERMYGTLLAECNKLRTKRGDDPAIVFWRGFALGFQARSGAKRIHIIFLRLIF